METNYFFFFLLSKWKQHRIELTTNTTTTTMKLKMFRNWKMRPFGRNANSLLPNVRSKCRPSLFSHFHFRSSRFFQPPHTHTHTPSANCVSVEWHVLHFPDYHRDTLCLRFWWQSRNRAIAWEWIERKKRRTKIDTRRMHTCVCSGASVHRSRLSFITKRFLWKHRMERCDSWCIFSNDDIIMDAHKDRTGIGIEWRHFNAHARQQWHWYHASLSTHDYRFRSELCGKNLKKATEKGERNLNGCIHYVAEWMWMCGTRRMRHDATMTAKQLCHACVHNNWH